MQGSISDEQEEWNENDAQMDEDDQEEYKEYMKQVMGEEEYKDYMD